jgi:hypothetical protein
MDLSKFQSHLSNLDKLEFRTPTRPFVPLLFLTQIAGARLRTGQHDLAITCFYARSYVVSVLVIRVGGSLQTVVKMFTDVLRTSACCMSCWRGDQQSGQYDHAKHKWHLALRYRHFSLPPILLRLALHRWGRRILALDPVPRPPGAVGRAKALRCDAFVFSLGLRQLNVDLHQNPTFTLPAN